MLENRYVKIAIIIGVGVAIGLSVWFGLCAIMGTPHPLMAVASGSMEPVLYRGDLILVEGITMDDVEVGDVIVFDRFEMFVTHRVIFKANVQDSNGTITDKVLLETKGDNNPAPDGLLVNEDMLIGRYTGSKAPVLGLFIVSFEIQIVIVILLLAVIIIAEVVTWRAN